MTVWDKSSFLKNARVRTSSSLKVISVDALTLTTIFQTDLHPTFGAGVDGGEAQGK